MCGNSSRSAFDYDTLEQRKEGDYNYFLAFDDGSSSIFLPDHAPRYYNRSYEVFTAYGNVENHLTWYDFTAVDACFEPCWPVKYVPLFDREM